MGGWGYISFSVIKLNALRLFLQILYTIVWVKMILGYMFGTYLRSHTGEDLKEGSIIVTKCCLAWLKAVMWFDKAVFTGEQDHSHAPFAVTV